MSPIASPSAEDGILLAKAKANDLDAFDALIRKYERRVIGLCFRHLRQYEEACDLAQEIFLQAFRSLPDFEGRSSFSTWLYRISLNACYNRQRFGKAKSRSSQRSLDAMLEEGGSLKLRSKDPGALANLEAEERKEELYAALGSLDLKQQSLIELVDIEGASYEEAAEVLDLPLNTLRSRLFRARAELKGKLERLRKRDERK